MRFRSKIKKCIFIACIIYISASFVHADSIVYNLRIAETTKDSDVVARLPEYPLMFTVTPFGQFRKKRDGTQRIFGGGLGTLVYITPTYYFRVDGAFARAVEKYQHVHQAHTQTDDILFSAGYSHHFTDRAKMTFSLLFGLPTHEDRHLEIVQFGYAHIGLGPQIDGAFHLGQLQCHSIRAAFRFIHFFPRAIPLCVNGAQQFVDFNLGNIIYLFLAYHINRGNNRFEVGFDESFFHHRRTCTDQEPTFMRSSYYAVYKRLFVAGNHPAAWALALSYGYDHKIRDGYKRLITLWTSFRFDF
jgi:hypothetical protein